MRMSEIDIFYTITYYKLALPLKPPKNRELFEEPVVPYEDHTVMALVMKSNTQVIRKQSIDVNRRIERWDPEIRQMQCQLWDWLESWIHQLNIHVIHDRSRNGFPKIKVQDERKVGEASEANTPEG